MEADARPHDTRCSVQEAPPHARGDGEQACTLLRATSWAAVVVGESPAHAHQCDARFCRSTIRHHRCGNNEQCAHCLGCAGTATLQCRSSALSFIRLARRSQTPRKAAAPSRARRAARASACLGWFCDWRVPMHPARTEGIKSRKSAGDALGGRASRTALDAVKVPTLTTIGSRVFASRAVLYRVCVALKAHGRCKAPGHPRGHQVSHFRWSHIYIGQHIRAPPKKMASAVGRRGTTRHRERL